jgi:hypothetical protein
MSVYNLSLHTTSIAEGANDELRSSRVSALCRSVRHDTTELDVSKYYDEAGKRTIGALVGALAFIRAAAGRPPANALVTVAPNDCRA